MIYYYKMHHFFLKILPKIVSKLLKSNQLKKLSSVHIQDVHQEKNINTILQISTFINCFIINEVKSI
jgi:hypothetical protein